MPRSRTPCCTASTPSFDQGAPGRLRRNAPSWSCSSHRYDYGMEMTSGYVPSRKPMAAWTPHRYTRHSWPPTHPIPPAPTSSGRIGLPPRVQFFVWLLVQRHVHSRSNLLKKSIVTDATCELCRNHPETVDHLAFACPVAASLWQHVGVALPLTVDTLHSMATPAPSLQNTTPCSSSCVAGTSGNTGTGWCSTASLPHSRFS